MGRSGRGSALPRSSARNGARQLLSPPLRGFLAEQTSCRLPSSAALRAYGCGSIAPRPCDRHRGRDGRGSRSDKENIMAIIGTFTKSGDGYTGSLKTVTLSVKAKITPAEKENDKAPDFRIFAGQAEFGAAWKRTSNAGREYLSVKLDDPSFPAPVFASLVIGIAIVILTLGVGALFLLVCRLTVDALPAFAGCAAGFWAYGTGAGPIGALALGVVGVAITLAAGRLAFGCSRSAVTRTCIAFVFAAPAAYVGYHVILGLAQYAVPSDAWRHAFA